jgi:hypothetical protein
MVEVALSALGLFGGGAPTSVHVWEVATVELSAAGTPTNPYVEGLPDSGGHYADAKFTGESGSAKGLSFTVPAFWDGGQRWLVRFAAPHAGRWSYRVRSADGQLGGASGRLEAADWSAEEKAENPTRHGFVRVASEGPRAGRTFAYEDGTPFLWIGDTWWNWTRKGIAFEHFKQLVDDRSAKGFSVGQMFLPGEGGFVDPKTELPDLDRLHDVEKMIAYANAKGITVWIHAVWGGKGDREIAENGKLVRWWRYVVDRLAAYNVVWVLAGEYNMDDYSGVGLPFWRKLGQAVHAEDPYGHVVGAHPTPPGWDGGKDAPQWSTADAIHDEKWLDFNQSQVGHGKWRNEMIPSVVASAYAKRPPKPIVVTEPWYEFVPGAAPAEDVRFGAWSAMLSGAAGHTYGGGRIWWAEAPGVANEQGPWPLEGTFEESLHYAGAESISFMGQFLRKTDWWNLEPHPELLSDTPSKFCSAVPGREYVVLLRWGGMVDVDLRPSAKTDRFSCTWIDLTTERSVFTGAVDGGAVREFHAPEDFPGSLKAKDWVLFLRKE